MKKNNDKIFIDWNMGHLEISPLGAMCGPVTFIFPNGKKIQPFAIAPWNNDNSKNYNRLPPVLKKLRGEWVCVPFGMPQPLKHLPEAWQPKFTKDSNYDNFFHGPSSNLEWKVMSRTNHAITLRIDYPKAHSIHYVERSITVKSNSTKLEFSLKVMPRFETSIPVGIHPVLKVTTTPQSTKLEVIGNTKVFTYPVDAEPNVSRIVNNQIFSNLEKVQTKSGHFVDLSLHPLIKKTEELVLITNTDGSAKLTNFQEKYAVNLNWNKEHFPSVNLWISNRGREFYPWMGEFQALGIEPVCAPFDLGCEVANKRDNPLVVNGVKCVINLIANKLWKTFYSIEVVQIQ